MKELIQDTFMAIWVLLVCLFIYGLVDNKIEQPKPKRQQIVTIKNNGQEIVYYVDNDKVKLSYQGE